MAAPSNALVYQSRRARGYIRDVWDRRGFVWFLATSNLRARNASTSLGLFWWVLNPLLLGMVYFVVFGIIFPIDRDIVYLMSGMFAFHFSSKSLSGGANSILRNSRLLSNLRFPRIVLPAANLIENAVGFMVSLLVLYAIVLLTGGVTLTWAVALLPVIILIQSVFNLGLSALTARLAIPYRDINNFIPYVNRVWLYVSPIIWPLSRLDQFSETLGDILAINPMYSLLGLYRAALIGYEFYPSQLWIASAWALGVAVVGVTTFVRSEGKMVRYL